MNASHSYVRQLLKKGKITHEAMGSRIRKLHWIILKDFITWMISGADSRKYPIATSSDPIRWARLADHTPQTAITIASSDRENTKTDNIFLIESWYKVLAGKIIINSKRSRLHEKRKTYDIYSLRPKTMAKPWFVSAMANASHKYGVVHRKRRFAHALLDRYLSTLLDKKPFTQGIACSI